jgi:hypothetical protein
MNTAEQKPQEHVRVQLAIRVFGFDEARGRFDEDTHTIVVSPTGDTLRNFSPLQGAGLNGRTINPYSSREKKSRTKSKRRGSK